VLSPAPTTKDDEKSTVPQAQRTTIGLKERRSPKVEDKN